MSLLALSGCAKDATKEDFDRVTAGMHRADVDKALERLGHGEPTTAKEVLHVFGGMEGRGYETLSLLEVVEWGSKKQPLFVGFDRAGTVRMKIIFTPNFKSIAPLDR